MAVDYVRASKAQAALKEILEEFGDIQAKLKKVSKKLDAEESTSKDLRCNVQVVRDKLTETTSDRDTLQTKCVTLEQEVDYCRDTIRGLKAVAADALRVEATRPPPLVANPVEPEEAAVSGT